MEMAGRSEIFKINRVDIFGDGYLDVYDAKKWGIMGCILLIIRNFAS